MKMAGFREIVQWHKMAGEPTTVGDTTVTPESSVLMVRLPGRWQGGYVWNRPVAVLVERGEERQRIPIVDVTRMAQVSLVMSLVALTFIMMIVSGRGKEQGE
jgi:hypothetical protein